jgi:hypothetical protein
VWLDYMLSWFFLRRRSAGGEIFYVCIVVFFEVVCVEMMSRNMSSKGEIISG